MIHLARKSTVVEISGFQTIMIHSNKTMNILQNEKSEQQMIALSGEVTLVPKKQSLNMD